MNILDSKKKRFENYKNIICIGNKTKLGSLLIKSLKKKVNKKKLINFIFEYYDSKEFLSKEDSFFKENISEKKLIVIFCATGGVRTEKHNSSRVKSSLEYDLTLLRQLVNYSKDIHILYISSVLGLINSKKNSDYSFCKREAELEFKKLFQDFNNIRKLSIIYPGRLKSNWFNFFLSGSITYKRLVKIIIKIISKGFHCNYYLTGIDAFIFVLIKRPRILKNLSLRII